MTLLFQFLCEDILKQIPILFAIIVLIFSACKDSNQGSITMMGVTEVILYQHEGFFNGLMGGEIRSKQHLSEFWK